MKVIDLTHTISNIMPVYPGTEQPRLTPASTYETDGFKETLITMFSHTGTHMDAPAHIFESRSSLDSLPVSHFVGKALAIDCSDLGLGGRITAERIMKYEAAESADFLLFFTGWDKKWGTEEYFGNYPCITEDAADFIIKSRKKGVGLDTIGIDPIADTNLSIHKKLFESNDIVVIENLTNLQDVLGEPFTFCALPMKYENSDGAPVRAVGIWD